MSTIRCAVQDKELERRGLRFFCRYADDLNVYVRSEAAGERVMASVTRFVEKRLRLRVKRTKSAVAHVRERKFLGSRLLAGGGLTIAPQSWHVPRKGSGRSHAATGASDWSG